ncbi:MAG: tRNA pseudouridine(38-40) synthase TruA [bacterium]
MRRYRLVIEYDGTPFCGWQRQLNAPSVQQVLEEAGEKLTGAKAVAVAAGRTDTGVHALAMGAHIDLEKELPAGEVQGGLNYHLRPHPVSVLVAQVADADFHARFSAQKRSYRYRLISRRAPLTLEVNRIWRIGHALNVDAMREAAQALIGQHDFTTFRASQCQAASPVKTLDHISVFRRGVEVWVECSAQSFLHNQVRSMVGSLERIGAERWPVGRMAEILAAADRNLCGPVAPACGLYFLQAEY